MSLKYGRFGKIPPILAIFFIFWSIIWCVFQFLLFFCAFFFFFFFFWGGGGAPPPPKCRPAFCLVSGFVGGGERIKKLLLLGWNSGTQYPRGRRYALRDIFVCVKTRMGLEPFDFFFFTITKKTQFHLLLGQTRAKNKSCGKFDIGYLEPMCFSPYYFIDPDQNSCGLTIHPKFKIS